MTDGWREMVRNEGMVSLNEDPFNDEKFEEENVLINHIQCSETIKYPLHFELQQTECYNTS